MNNSFQKVKSYLVELNYTITHEKEDEGIFVIENETEGIKNLIIGCLDPILIIEQFMFELKNDSSYVYKNLLQKNREIVHGAFVVDESGKKVIFRDTLELENLDINELEASINSLSMLLTEYTDDLIKFSKN